MLLCSVHTHIHTVCVYIQFGVAFETLRLCGAPPHKCKFGIRVCGLCLCVYASLCVCAANVCRSLPIEPSQQVLGSGDQLYHGGEELVRRFARRPSAVRRAPSPLGCQVVQVVGSRPHLPHQHLQVVRLHPIILPGNKNSGYISANVFMFLFYH